MQQNTLWTPRSIERGPGEACFWVWMLLWLAGTPRSIERGPVEACEKGIGMIAAAPATPRSIERGPVEARWCC